MATVSALYDDALHPSLSCQGDSNMAQVAAQHRW